MSSPLTYALSVPTGCTGSYFKSYTSTANQATTITLYKVALGSQSMTSFGNVYFAAGAFEATFSCTATSFAAGDSIVPIGGETSSTPTLGNIGGEIVGTR